MPAPDFSRHDPEDMYGAIRTFTQQFSVGRESAQEVPVPEHVPSQVVIAGMGGSAMGGDLLRSLAAPTAQVPITVNRGYTLPAHVDDRALVLVSSYSGNTEETLAALHEALSRNAQIIALSSGGTVTALADAHGFPVVEMPGGMQPRAALGYSLAALVTLAERLELLPSQKEAWVEATRTLEGISMREADPNTALAYTIARRIGAHTPLIYSGNGLLETVNVRWRGQIQENAKRLAFGNVLPELNHNEIMGWEEDAAVHMQLAILMLRDVDDHPAVQRRARVTKELLLDRAGAWIDVASEGEARLTRLLSTVHLGDWVSFYLAMEDAIDPTPVRLISRLKATLADT